MIQLNVTPLPGLTLIRTKPFQDARGRFERIFCKDDLAPVFPNHVVAQANLSVSHTRGTVRGLHYQQHPMLEAKIVRCLRGRVYDVAVDLRSGSSTFLQWFGIELDQDEPVALLIPEGFAHGFQTLTDDVQMLYLHSTPWSRECEGGIRHDDPTLGVRWPLPVSEISIRDAGLPFLAKHFSGLVS